MNKVSGIDEYIAGFPKETQALLENLRTAIKKAAPDAKETINYGMPTFTLMGNLVHFAAYQKHIGFYPAPSGIETFKKELSVYKGAKGSVQFPLDKPLPLALVAKIVTFRVKENIEKAAAKNLRKCKNGHSYYKTSDCPTCPICEQERKPKEGFLSVLSAPARRALENVGITNLKQLSNYTEAELLELHGMGKSSIPKLLIVLEAKGLMFRKNKK